MMLDHKELKRLLAYDRRTGLFRWRVGKGRIRAGDVAGTPTYQGYIQISIAGRKYKAHRLAWFYVKGEWPEHEVDHHDTNRSNNRWRNLRDLPGKVNAQNKRRAYSTNVTGVLGVSACGKGYRARICVDGQQKSLGSFTTKRAAKAAYIEAKRELHAGCSL